MMLHTVPTLSFEPDLEHPAIAGTFQQVWYGGPENRLAYHIARKLVEPSGGRTPDQPLPSTLVLYGPHASGKSMLLQWLYEGLRRRLPSPEVQFPALSEWARRSHRGTARSTTRPLPALTVGGILLLDDLHQLADRPSAQRELIARLDSAAPFHQLIVACLDAPWSTRLQPQLVSRLSAGLAVRMSPPGTEARRAFVQDFERRSGVAFSPEAVRWLVHNYRGTFADLGQLVRTCCQRLSGLGPVALSHVKQFAGNDGSLPPNAPKLILAAVCREFGVSQRDLLGHSRRRTIVTARAVAIHALRQVTDWSLEAIGAFVGKRDHSTVLNALRRVNALVEQDPSLRSRIDNVVQGTVASVTAQPRRSAKKANRSVDNVKDSVVTCRHSDRSEKDN